MSVMSLLIEQEKVRQKEGEYERESERERARARVKGGGHEMLSELFPSTKSSFMSSKFN